MEELAKQIAAALGQLGVEGARVWPQLVAQTYIIALFWTIALPILMAGSTIGTIYVWKWARDGMREEPSDTDFCITIAIIITIATAIFLLVSFFSWPDDLARAMYPEAATVRDLLGR